MLYTQGKAVKFDKINSYAWLNIAASSSQADIRSTALSARALLEATMSSDELNKAQALSQEYYKKITQPKVGTEVYVADDSTKKKTSAT
jgi:hypothetical protein